jgi:hypothetical protein
VCSFALKPLILYIRLVLWSRARGAPSVPAFRAQERAAFRRSGVPSRRGVPARRHATHSGVPGALERAACGRFWSAERALAACRHAGAPEHLFGAPRAPAPERSRAPERCGFRRRALRVPAPWGVPSSARSGALAACSGARYPNARSGSGAAPRNPRSGTPRVPGNERRNARPGNARRYGRGRHKDSRRGRGPGAC